MVSSFILVEIIIVIILYETKLINVFVVHIIIGIYLYDLMLNNFIKNSNLIFFLSSFFFC